MSAGKRLVLCRAAAPAQVLDSARTGAGASFAPAGRRIMQLCPQPNGTAVCVSSCSAARTREPAGMAGEGAGDRRTDRVHCNIRGRVAPGTADDLRAQPEPAIEQLSTERFALSNADAP